MMQKTLENEQISRIHEHRMHYVNIFYQRLNVFLIFESILLGVVGLVSSKSLPSPFIVRGIAAFGLAITLIWWYTQARQKYMVYMTDIYAREVIPEYGELMAKMKKEVFSNLTGNLLTHAIPVLTLLLWTMLLFFL